MYSKIKPFILLLGLVTTFSGCLGTLVESRCHSDGFFSRSDCEMLTAQTLTLMDFEYDFDSRSLTFFSKELIDLMQNEKVRSYLKNLDQKLRESFVHFDLYSFTVFHFVSTEMAERVLSVLIQDHVRGYHVNWLKHVHAHRLTTAALERVIIKLKNKDLLSKINFYPPRVSEEMKSHFNKKIYYFYFPKIIFETLIKQGVSPSIARRWVQYVMLTYKSHHHYQGYLSSFWNQHPLLKTNGFAELTTQEQSQWVYRIRDVYMGYVSADGTMGFSDFFDHMIHFDLVNE